MINAIKSVSNEAYNWIKSNRPLFIKTNSKKIRFEYLQYKLFSKQKNYKKISSILLEEIFKINPSNINHEAVKSVLSDESLLNHEKMDFLALCSITDDKLYLSQMKSLIDESLLADLVSNKLPLDILVSREMMYTITHLVMYSSVFGTEDTLLEYIKLFSNINHIVELALLISISQSDMDVFFELLLCVYFLDLEDNLTPTTVSIIKELLQVLPRKNGAIQTFSSSKYHSWDFEDVYHTTLVGGILYHVIINKHREKSESINANVLIPANVSISLLMNLDEPMLDKIIKQSELGNTVAIDNIEVLLSEGLIIKVILLKAIFEENFTFASKITHLIITSRHVQLHQFAYRSNERIRTLQKGR